VPRHIALLRGINLGSRRRVAMGDLRDLLAGLGYGGVRTHLQSGNVVLSGDVSGPELERALSGEPDPAVVEELASADVAPERFVAIGREIYAWHPEGIQRSALAALLTEQRLGVTPTARNWNTVTKLLALADDE
jgi:uncharacterized protein (DUF1697 family)